VAQTKDKRPQSLVDFQAVRFVLITAVVVMSVTGRAWAQTPPQNTPPPPSRIRTLVLNGTHRVGLAASVSSALQRRGFAIQRLKQPWVANAPEPAPVTAIYFDATQPKARVAAAALRARFEATSIVRPTTKLIRRISNHAGQPLLIVVLGSSFHGLK
jgi:hypothetical protein